MTAEMPDRLLPAPMRLEAEAVVQRDYSERFGRHLEWLQCRANAASDPVHLTFYPIAKNIRLVATALFRNVDRSRRTCIAPGNDGEEEDMRSEGGPPWKPWLWSRIPRGQLHNVEHEVDEAELAWPTYFLDIVRAEGEIEIPQRDRPDWRRGPLEKGRILRMAACARFAFRLNEHMRAVVSDWRERSGWDEEEPTLGIHLRRGDAATEDLEMQTRPSYSLEEYLADADILCNTYGIRTVYLSTESEAEIRRARELRPQYRFLSLAHDRSVFPNIADSSIFIEDLALSDHSVIEPIVNSAVADLWFLQNCNAFIGTFNSEFSVLAWLLCVGQNGFIVPYVNLAIRAELELFQGRLEFG